MPKINLWAVLVAAVVAFVVGALWYSPLLFARAYTEVRGMTPPGAMAAMRPPVWEMLGEFVKNIVVAYVLAYFVVRLGVGDWKSALQLGLWVWVGFQAMLLMGAVLHEKMPSTLYAIHAGDALVKTLLTTVILGVWRR
jgi:hypothetical protein